MEWAMDFERLAQHLLRLINLNEALTILGWGMVAAGLARLSTADGRRGLWSLIQAFSLRHGNSLYVLLPLGMILLFVV